MILIPIYLVSPHSFFPLIYLFCMFVYFRSHWTSLAIIPVFFVYLDLDVYRTFFLSLSRCVSSITILLRSVSVSSIVIFFWDPVMFSLSRSWCKHISSVAIFFCDPVIFSLSWYWCRYVLSVVIFCYDLDMFRLLWSSFVIYIDPTCLWSSWLIFDCSDSFWWLPGCSYLVPFCHS